MRNLWYLLALPLAIIGKGMCWKSDIGSIRWNAGVRVFYWAIVMSTWSVKDK